MKLACEENSSTSLILPLLKFLRSANFFSSCWHICSRELDQVWCVPGRLVFHGSSSGLDHTKFMQIKWTISLTKGCFGDLEKLLSFQFP